MAVPHPITRQRVLFSLLAYRGIPIRIRVEYSLLLACTQWFQLIFPSFGWYVIPVKHFPQKSLSGNPKIGFPFSPSLDYTFSYLWPMAHHFLYWLGTGWWCLSFVHAPLPCVSIACLLFMCLPWLEGLSVHSTACSWPFMVWMFSLSLRSLRLTSFLSWALLDCGLFLL